LAELLEMESASAERREAAQWKLQTTRPEKSSEPITRELKSASKLRNSKRRKILLAPD
jgi:hypothetical protein